MEHSTALVTGATSGLGYAAARSLAEEGWGEIIITGRSLAKVKETAAQLASIFGREFTYEHLRATSPVVRLVSMVLPNCVVSIAAAKATPPHRKTASHNSVSGCSGSSTTQACASTGPASSSVVTPSKRRESALLAFPYRRTLRAVSPHPRSPGGSWTLPKIRSVVA
jgi:hypothetical protein